MEQSLVLECRLLVLLFLAPYSFLRYLLVCILVRLALDCDIKPVHYTCSNLTAMSTFDPGYIISLNYTKL